MERMSPDEALAFEQRMRTDEELRSRVEELRLVMLGISQSLLRSKLDEFHTLVPGQDQKPAVRRSSGWYTKWAMAASLLVIVALTAWWGLARRHAPDTLFSRYYKPDPGLMTLMTEGNSNYVFEKAMVEYKNGDYNQALSAWTGLLRQQPDNDTLLYFSGSAALAAGRYAEAIRYLKPVAGYAGGAFRNDARWYLGLAYLGAGHKDSARVQIGLAEHPGRPALLKALRR